MLIRKLLQTRKADANLPTEIRAALVDALFAPIASLIVGAVACSIIGAAVAFRAGDPSLLAVSTTILAVGLIRVISAILYKRYKLIEHSATKFWELVYEYGAWAFSGLLGLLCWLTITHTNDSSLQMAVTTISAGYGAAISGRNAARPFIAVGQLTLCTLPMAVRFEEQANRFDVALNNMSHGLSMLDAQDRLQVWNERFLELLHLQNAPVRVAMRLTELIRYSLRARNYTSKSVKTEVSELVRGLRQDNFDQFQISLDGARTIAISRRMMPDGGSVIIFEDVTERNSAQERIAHLARFDELTGLATRTQFRERIAATLAAVQERENHLAVHLIDLDRFKTINDTLGHPIGDMLLKEVAERLRAIVTGGDMITRFGGDEFIILQSATPRQQDANALALRIANTIREPFEISGHRIDIGATIGIAMEPHDGVEDE